MKIMVYVFFAIQALFMSSLMAPYMVLEASGNVKQVMTLAIGCILLTANIFFIRMLTDKGPCKQCAKRQHIA